MTATLQRLPDFNKLLQAMTDHVETTSFDKPLPGDTPDPDPDPDDSEPDGEDD